MRIFVDTSAIYALIVPEDANHSLAVHCFQQLLEECDATLVSSNYVLLECSSLIKKRHGFEPAKRFLDKINNTLEVFWVTQLEHQEAVIIWSEARDKNLSLVDCTSFVLMRQQKIQHAVAFDADFEKAGFILLPKKVDENQINEVRVPYHAKKTDRRLRSRRR